MPRIWRRFSTGCVRHTLRTIRKFVTSPGWQLLSSTTSSCEPVPTGPDPIQFEWLQTNSDYPFRAHQLSDGTLRFICLATAMLQPVRPGTMLFDEPELGLHPYALTLLGDLLKRAAQHGKQVIVSTQSALLLNEFEPPDVVVVERHQGESTFKRLELDDLSEWLGEYSLGELWQKNVLGGRPGAEHAPQAVPDGAEHR